MLCVQLTMSNVPPRSHTLWVHLVSVWVISLWTMWVSQLCIVFV